jgi:hypothetical protein
VLFPLIYLHEDFNKFTVNDGYCDCSSHTLVVTEIFNNFSNRFQPGSAKMAQFTLQAFTDLAMYWLFSHTLNSGINFCNPYSLVSICLPIARNLCLQVQRLKFLVFLHEILLIFITVLNNKSKVSAKVETSGALQQPHMSQHYNLGCHVRFISKL